MSEEAGEAGDRRNERRSIADRAMDRRTRAEVGVAEPVLASSYVHTCTSGPRRTWRRLGIARVGVSDWRLHSCFAATSTRTGIPNQKLQMQDRVAGVTDVAICSGSAITSATRHASAPMATTPAGGGVSELFSHTSFAETPAPAEERKEPLEMMEWERTARGRRRDRWTGLNVGKDVGRRRGRRSSLPRALTLHSRD